MSKKKSKIEIIGQSEVVAEEISSIPITAKMIEKSKTQEMEKETSFELPELIKKYLTREEEIAIMNMLWGDNPPQSPQEEKEAFEELKKRAHFFKGAWDAINFK